MDAGIVKKKINIATPIVWANHAYVINYIQNLKKLIKQVNHELAEENYEIGKAMIDTYGDVNWAQIPQEREISMVCHREHSIESFGMAYYWYQSVTRAFFGDVANKVAGVLYLPVDITFGTINGNTVADPKTIAGMIKAMMEQESEYLMIGNYQSTNFNKEKIEKTVRFILQNEFPDLPDEVKRVRSEYWSISADLFSEFEVFYHKNFHLRKGGEPVQDPSLLMLLYCLHWNKNVMPYNLGTYHVEDTWPIKKRKKQISRAVKLIYNFLDKFGAHASENQGARL